MGGKPEPIVHAEFRVKEYISIFEEAKKDWFEALMFADFLENLSFASFYSRKVIRIIPKAVCVLLPLITEDIKSYAVIFRLSILSILIARSISVLF